MNRLTEALRAATPDSRWVDEMRRTYPFFTIPMAMELATCTDDDERRRLLMRLRLSVPSPEVMERLAGTADPRFDSFYPPVEKPRTPDTDTAIDDFLSRYATASPEEEALLERMIFNPVPDYAQQLAREAESSLPAAPPEGADSPDDRISRFILADRSANHPAPPPVGSRPVAPATPATRATPAATATPATPAATATPATPAATATPATPAEPSAPAHAKKRRTAIPVPGENTLLSESLAKIYIKSHKYERAFEILSRLSLEFPEKSRYFADQLRFLRKLIINEQYRNQSSIPSKGGESTAKN